MASVDTSRRGGRLGRWSLGGLLLLTLVAALALTFVVRPGDDPASDDARRASSTTATAPSSPAPATRARVNGRHVVAISVDGLTPLALSKLGPRLTPNIHRLLRKGAGTTNARTQIEMTVTLPNHTSMVTGRRISAAQGGHGVTWNDDTVPRPTVQEAAGREISSVFEVVKAAGGSSAVFSTKTKFSLWKKSWPASVDRLYIRKENDTAVTNAMTADLASKQRAFYFLHLGIADQTGHASGWMSSRYLSAVRRADALVGSVLRTIAARPALQRTTTVVLTADHGGLPGTKGHSDARRWQNYTVPFAIYGAGVRAVPLYRLNPTRRDPGRSQPGFGAARQPVRNGEVANVSLRLLGLGPVPGSLWNRRQDLRWR